MPKLFLSLSHLFIALSLTLPTATIYANEYKFPGSSFGKLLLLPNQTTGGNDAIISAQKGGAFEAISEFNADDRYRQFSASIARLDMLLEDSNGEQYVSTCTANLVDVNVLLTNYHCIPGNKKSVKVIRSLAVFDYLREDQGNAPKFEVDVTPLAASYENDFALLRVQGEPGKKFGFFKLQPRKAKANQSLFIIHHPAGMPKRLTRFRCKAYSPTPYSQAYFRHRCDTLGGSSGSLIFNLNFEVVALHNQGGLTKDSHTSFNRGISIFSLLQDRSFSAMIVQKTTGDSVPLTRSSSQLTLPYTAHCDTVQSARICASSMLQPQGGGKYNYRMKNVTRNDGAAWVENHKSYGIGEWLLFDFNQPKTVSSIKFNNGYTRTEKVFHSNSRVAKITLEFSNGEKHQMNLQDIRTTQSFSFPQQHNVKWVKIVIKDVYRGTKYSDTALSYVAFE